MARQHIANGQHIAVEMQGAFGHAGGARGESDQGDIVLGGVGMVKRRAVRVHLLFSALGVVWRGLKVQHMGQARAVDLGLDQGIGQGVLAQGGRDLGFLHDHRELARAQQGHGGDGDATGFEHRQPSQGQVGAVFTPQQDAATGGQAPVFADHPGQLVDARQQLPIGVSRCLTDQRSAIALTTGHRCIEQFCGRIQPRRVGRGAGIEHQLGPLLGWGQMIAGKTVGVSAGVKRGGKRGCHGRQINQFKKEA